jgi:hypothetical protein
LRELLPASTASSKTFFLSFRRTSLFRKQNRRNRKIFPQRIFFAQITFRSLGAYSGFFVKGTRFRGRISGLPLFHLRRSTIRADPGILDFAQTQKDLKLPTAYLALKMVKRH